MADISFEEFCYVHEYQIYRTIAFPKNLIEELYKCLKGPRNNDLNEYFEIRKFKNSRKWHFYFDCKIQIKTHLKPYQRNVVILKSMERYYLFYLTFDRSFDLTVTFTT